MSASSKRGTAAFDNRDWLASSALTPIATPSQINQRGRRPLRPALLTPAARTPRNASRLDAVAANTPSGTADPNK